MLEDGEEQHRVADGAKDIVSLAAPHHVGALAKGQILHDVEAKVAEPLGNVYGLAVIPVDDLDDLIDGPEDVGLVTFNGFDVLVAVFHRGVD